MIQIVRSLRHQTDGIKEFIKTHLDNGHDWIDFTNPTLEFYLAFNEDILVGVSSIKECSAFDCSWLLYKCVTHPGYRKQGIMTELISRTIDCKTGGILCEAWARGFTANIHQPLVNNGFQRYGIIEDFWKLRYGCENCRQCNDRISTCDSHIYIKD